MLKKYRRFFTSSVGFTFLVVGGTGVFFKLFFKNHLLEEIHGWLGIAMVVAATIHIVQNWPAIRSYLRDVRVIALLLPILFVINYFVVIRVEPSSGVSPKRVVRKLSEGKMTDVAQALGQDAQLVFAAMQKAGINVESPSETLQEIARRNQKPPESLMTYFIR